MPALLTRARAWHRDRQARIREAEALARRGLRLAEIERVWRAFGLSAFDVVLEIGGGAGDQAVVLGGRCELLLTTDIALPAETVPLPPNSFRLGADAQHLPFRPGAFDLVFSSNVVEHVPDRAALGRELRRVTQPGALLLHIVPTTTWKLLQRVSKPLFRACLLEPQVWRYPVRGTHGAYPSWLAEARVFRVSSWRRLWREMGFTIVREEPLFLNCPQAIFNRFTIPLGRLLGLSSTRVFLLRKTDPPLDASVSPR